jgi:hypothetical protein
VCGCQVPHALAVNHFVWFQAQVLLDFTGLFSVFLGNYSAPLSP